MIRKKIRGLAVIVALGIMCAGCGNGNQNNTEDVSVTIDEEEKGSEQESRENNSEVDESEEVSGEGTKESEEEGTEESGEEKTSSEDSTGESEKGSGEVAESQISEGTRTEITNNSNIQNQNGYFVKIGDDVYFHVSTPEGLNSTALFDNFMGSPKGATALYKYNVKSGEVTRILEDYAYGKMSVTGDTLCYMNSEDDISSQAVFYNTKDESLESKDNLSLIAGDEDGSRVYFLEYDQDEDAYYVNYCLNGEIQDSRMVGSSFDHIKTTEGYMFFNAYSSQAGYERVLYELNLESMKLYCLGAYPELEDSTSSGIVDQLEVHDGKVYLGYGEYQGTGSFYYYGHYLCATLDEKDSLTQFEAYSADDTYATGADEYPSKTPAFRFEGDEFVLCSGEVGKADIGGNLLGYYDDDYGKFHIVGEVYGWVDQDDYGDDIVDVEICERIGNDIYYIVNDSEHIPDEDIGWRYAYSRYKVGVYKINISTGEITELLTVSK